MTKFRRSTRGLSPIFATLILIAIAVIAGIVVYMFTSGTIASMTGGGTAGQEKAAVQGVDVAGAASVVYAQNTGGVTISITARHRNHSRPLHTYSRRGIGRNPYVNFPVQIRI